MDRQSVAVFGITGQQGSWAARFFLEAGWRVVGISRSGEQLSDPHLQGAEMRAGDLTDAESVRKAVHDCHVVFAITNPWKGFAVDEQLEQRQVQGLLEGCKAAGTKHLIFSSVLSRGKWELTDEVTVFFFTMQMNMCATSGIQFSLFPN